MAEIPGILRPSVLPYREPVKPGEHVVLGGYYDMAFVDNMVITVGNGVNGTVNMGNNVYKEYVKPWGDELADSLKTMGDVFKKAHPKTLFERANKIFE